MIKISLAILSFLAIFLINKFRIKIASITQLVDRPDKIRKFHEVDTPLLGGIMLFFPFFLVLIEN